MKVKISKLHYQNFRDSLIAAPLFLLISFLLVLFDRKFASLVCIYTPFFFLMAFLFCRGKLSGIVIIEKDKVFSSRWWRKRCEIDCSRTVYYYFFRGVIKAETSRYSSCYPEGKDGKRFYNLGARLYNIVDEDYIMLSHKAIPPCAAYSRLLAYDESTQIVLPYTEDVKQALSPYLSRFNWIWDGGELTPPAEPTPPPLPPDGTPPFTGRWNSRF